MAQTQLPSVPCKLGASVDQYKVVAVLYQEVVFLFLTSQIQWLIFMSNFSVSMSLLVSVEKFLLISTVLLCCVAFTELTFSQLNSHMLFVKTSVSFEKTMDKVF